MNLMPLAVIAETSAPTPGILGFLLVANGLLIISALIGVLLNTRRTGTSKLGWALAVVLVPVLGPVAWFLFGRRSGSASLPIANRSSHS